MRGRQNPMLIRKVYQQSSAIERGEFTHRIVNNFRRDKLCDMPCPEYDAIMHEWEPALKEFDSACMPTSSTKVSDKKRFEREDRAKGSLDAIETRRNWHVSACPICIAEGHKPNFDSTARHHR
jgi:hypothetical protein